jgi:hypothetical protein
MSLRRWAEPSADTYTVEPYGAMTQGIQWIFLSCLMGFRQVFLDESKMERNMNN